MQFTYFISLAVLSASLLVGQGAALPTSSATSNACVLSPDVARTDYVANPPVRQDVTDGQVGIAFTLDITVMDVTTCKPFSNAMVELWSANAVGEYGDFLRGAFTTASNGVAEFQTIFPGYTSDGANHMNIAVHQTSDISSPIIHTGELFFTDPWTNIIAMSTTYNQNTNTRIMDAQDPDYATANSNGNNAIISVTSIQDDWPTGIIGTITVGVDPSK
ncbi:uncharacterized protein ARMOST_09392 [Armillaria ostoyae]|uniref:Intradiol ring-cleavage dioxygenases domain-containing protein n=1 Tax=Armillaria ostoyae TaxID=47428 RepID=A0A284RBC8_ARMOS|nr:uncharacterized protein ARMOST_09392 [Armillaria ostoyae]